MVQMHSEGRYKYILDTFCLNIMFQELAPKINNSCSS